MRDRERIMKIVDDVVKWSVYWVSLSNIYGLGYLCFEYWVKLFIFDDFLGFFFDLVNVYFVNN